MRLLLPHVAVKLAIAQLGVFSLQLPRSFLKHIISFTCSAGPCTAVNTPWQGNDSSREKA